METTLQEMKIQKTHKQGEAYLVENIKLNHRIKELEEKVIQNLTLNNIEGKIDIKHTKEEMNKLLSLDNETHISLKLERSCSKPVTKIDFFRYFLFLDPMFNFEFIKICVMRVTKDF